jgi:EAL domain-containing protein (putative c-di-GMP-specific phosphodiesterase class I)
MKRMSISEDLRAAIDRGELFLEYLPTVMLADSHCVGGEALVRWRRNREVLAAEAFIPLIENTPVSGTLTYWVLDTVATELGEWLGENSGAHVSINIPPEILGRGGLAYVASRTGLCDRLNQIVLEITERGVPDRLGLDALNLMAERGIRIALDDVMMNGANLALLTRCNFSMIKLDRELIAQLTPDKPHPEWFAGLRDLLKRSSLQVVAEGVTSAHQARALHAIGVQMAQGYFYSAGLTAPALMAFYRGAHGLSGGLH